MKAATLLTAGFDLLVAAGCAFYAQSTFRDLFVDVPRIHFAYWRNGWSMLNVAMAIGLLAAVAGVIMAAMRLFALKHSQARRTARRVELCAIAVVAIAFVTSFFAFLSELGPLGG